MNRTLKKIISGLTTLSMCAAMIGIMPVSAEDSLFSGGYGTEDSPYLISSAADLAQLSTDVDGGNEYIGKYFKMTQDITLSGDWNSIGSVEYSIADHAYSSDASDFAGVFDGNGYKISGLFQNVSMGGSDYAAGLFAANKGTIKNLSVSGEIHVNGADNWELVGGIAAYNDGIIDNCSYEGTLDFSQSVYGWKPIGGIVGFNAAYGSIDQCTNAANITVATCNTMLYVGGIVGYNYSGTTIINSSNTGEITVVGYEDSVPDTANVGGIIGCKGDTMNCFSNPPPVSVDANIANVGPSIGSDGSAQNCYYCRYESTASLSSDDEVMLMTDRADGSIEKTAEEFASGEVAYLLNNQQSNNNVIWRQTLGTDSVPTFEKGHKIIYYTADTGTYSNISPNASNKRPLTVEFFGVGNEPAAEGKRSGNLNAENATNKDKFWVGVGVESVNDLQLFKNGIYSLEIAFEYDPNYIRPDAQNGVSDEVKEQTWHDDIVAANTASGKEWGNYFVESAIETSLDTENDRANKDKLTERANWKMCTVCLYADETTVQNLRFTDLDSSDKQYLIKIPFTLISAPHELDADQNPIVLSLVRGPETFDIGSGNIGKIPNAKWNETENEEADNNLRTYFDFKGDVKLFGEDLAITDIIPFRNIPQKDENGDPIKDAEENILTEEETYELSQDTNLDGGEFNPEVKTYYLSISNQPNNLQLRIQSSEAVTVTVNGTQVNVTLVDGNYVTDPFELNELEQNPDGTYKSDEFRNTVVVSTGDESNGYTIHVRRLLQPRIELNYGNSPYGEIMKTNWTDAQKKEAKEAFNIANKYGRDSEGNLLIPPQAADKTQLYHMRAWVDITTNNIQGLDSLTAEEQAKLADPNVNIDRNETAIFIYNGEPFVDPGFTAITSMGEVVTKLDRTIKVRRLAGQTNWQLIADDRLQAEEEITIKDQPSNVLITDITREVVLENQKAVENTLPIRPDIYEMTYSFENSYDGKVEIKRKVVVLQPEGDGNFSGTFNDNDFIPINAWMLNSAQFSTLVTTDTARRIYLYKTLDINYTETINDNDFIPLNSYMLDSKRIIPTSYVKLPSVLSE